jgi:hypothetical protein
MSSVFNQENVTAAVSAGAIYAIVHSSPRLSREVPPHVAAIASLCLYIIQKSVQTGVKPISRECYWNLIRSCITHTLQCAALASQMSVPKTSLVWTLHILVSEGIACAHRIMQKNSWTVF